MQEFIVTGRLPGTDFVITFHDVVVFVAVAAGSIMLWQIYRHLRIESTKKNNADASTEHEQAAVDYNVSSSHLQA